MFSSSKNNKYSDFCKQNQSILLMSCFIYQMFFIFIYYESILSQWYTAFKIHFTWQPFFSAVSPCSPPCVLSTNRWIPWFQSPVLTQGRILML